MTNFIYCDCCDSASVELSNPPPPDAFYMCNICREYCYHVDVRPNNVKQEQVIEYSN
jgi:hypothetical protein